MGGGRLGLIPGTIYGAPKPTYGAPSTSQSTTMCTPIKNEQIKRKRHIFHSQEEAESDSVLVDNEL